MMFPATVVILAITAVATIIAFRRTDLQERWIFKPYEILTLNQYERMLISGLIHADWTHFGFNAFSFYSFAKLIEVRYGWKTLVLVYLAAILGGSALSLFIHRHHDYRALGASGGVCGVIFASIFLLPGGSIMMLPLPVAIPSYLYAVIFMVGSFVALRRQRDHIGHDAHLGGAIVGLLTATVMYPDLVLAAPWMFTAVFGLSVVILLVLILDPFGLLDRRLKREAPLTGGERAQRYQENRQRNERLAKVDRILEKVSAHGLQSLTAAERKILEQRSKEIGGRP